MKAWARFFGYCSLLLAIPDVIWRFREFRRNSEFIKKCCLKQLIISGLRCILLALAVEMEQMTSVAVQTSEFHSVHPESVGDSGSPKDEVEFLERLLKKEEQDELARLRAHEVQVVAHRTRVAMFRALIAKARTAVQFGLADAERSDVGAKSHGAPTPSVAILVAVRSQEAEFDIRMIERSLDDSHPGLRLAWHASRLSKELSSLCARGVIMLVSARAKGKGATNRYILTPR